jgi:hypothetical protein
MLRKPIQSQEERILVNSLKKKSKKVNVYFNKKTKGKSKYLIGDFYSKKNDETFKYRSSYELAFFHQLEADSNVVNYMYEPFEVAYIDFHKQERNYRPDLLILNADGSVIVAEIKPSAMLGDFDVQAKATAARKYIQNNYKDYRIEYKFITEKHIFSNNTEYVKFVAETKNRQF